MSINVGSLLFALLVLVYSLTTNDKSTSSLSFMKYAVLSLCILQSGYVFYHKRIKIRNIRYKAEFRGLMIFVSVIIFYSIIKSLMAWHFSFRTVQELIFLICPMVYSYFAINIWTKSQINYNMRIGFIITFCSYLLSLGMNFQTMYYGLISSNFNNSYSELESFVFCGFALAFCIYFCYYNRNRVFSILSLLFVVMTFKRLFIVMAIIMFILTHFEIRNKKVTRKWYWMTISFLVIFGIAYYNIILPENVIALQNKYNINISALTSTRSDRLRWLVTSSYSTYGFGSSTEYMYAHFNGALEMDAIKLIIELGYIPLVAMIISYVKASKANVYVFTFMIFELLNLIFSSGLTGTFAWSIIFISIASITYYPESRK